MSVNEPECFCQLVYDPVSQAFLLHYVSLDNLDTPLMHCHEQVI